MFKILSSITLILSAALLGLSQKTAGYDDLMFFHQSDLLLSELIPAALYYENEHDERSELEVLFPEPMAVDAEHHFNQLIGLFHLHPNYAAQLIQDKLYEIEGTAERNQLAIALGGYYYNQQDYHQAIISYDLIEDDETLSEATASAYHFKKGYCLFVTKQFQAARRQFSKTKNTRDIYYFPTNYYHAMSSYFEGDMKAAISGFERVRASDKYSPSIPYYLSQIYFAEQEYDKLISYAELELQKPKIDHKDKIKKILGQAYFQRGRYEEAKPLLVIDESDQEALTSSETFQIAYVLYQLGQVEESIPYFAALSLQPESSAHQLNSTILLADSYLKTNRPQEAQSALYTAINAKEIKKPIRDQLIINYAKLTSQDHQYQDALNALGKISKSSAKYNEARDLMTTIYLNTDDYIGALTFIDKLENPSTDIKAKAQILQYNQGVKFYQDDLLKESVSYFSSAIENDQDPQVTLDALFWLGSIYRQDQKLKKSTAIYNQYFVKSESRQTTSEESRKWIAYYNQGYNWMDQNKLEDAAQYFDLSVQSYRVDDANSEYTLIYEDALLRSGDLSLQQKNYTKSLERYFKANQIPEAKHPDYSRYQTALIQGFLGTDVQKIVLLESVINDYPTSEYIDNAIYHAADAYLSMGNEAKAKQEFTKLLSEYPNSPFSNKARLKLGLINYNAGAYDESLSQYEQILNADPAPAELVQANEAIKEIYINEKSDSEGYFKLIESHPSLDQVTDYEKDSLSYAIAKEKYDTDAGPEALAQFSMYLSRYQQGFYTADALYYQADIQAKLDQYTAALASYEKLLTQGDSRLKEKALLKAGAIAYKLSDYEKAASYHKKIISANDPETSEIANYSVLESLYQLKKVDEYGPYALRVIQSALASEKQKRFAQYCLATSAYKDGRIIEALDYYRQVTAGEKNIRSAESLYQMAEINFKRNDLPQANELLSQLTTEYSSYHYWVARGVILLSDVYLKNEEYIRAKAALDSILQNYTDQGDGIISLAASKKQSLTETILQQNQLINTENSDTLILEYNNNQ